MEVIIKELGAKIDAMKNESATKAELIEVMSKIANITLIFHVLIF